MRLAAPRIAAADARCERSREAEFAKLPAYTFAVTAGHQSDPVALANRAQNSARAG
jgi:hypothetical protein